MVSTSLKKLSCISIKSSFVSCGIAPRGVKVDFEKLNSNLKNILSIQSKSHDENIETQQVEEIDVVINKDDIDEVFEYDKIV